jgi:hypothetical protein
VCLIVKVSRFQGIRHVIADVFDLDPWHVTSG